MDKKNISIIKELRHELHRHPELSLQETGTIQRIREFLTEHTSLTVQEKDGWLYAVKEGSDPEAGSIAFRADMDALPISEEDMEIPYRSDRPGISHKCGHDGHCAALCALALELDTMETRQNIFLIFQGAEEIGEGAKKAISLIREKQIREIYAFHNLSGYPEGEIRYRRGLTQPASEGLTIGFHGRISHASTPEEGANPSAAIARTALYSQEITKEPHHGMALCTIVGMQAGSGDFGISAGEGKLLLTLRAEAEQDMKDMEERILSFAKQQAAADGLGTDFAVSDYFPETRNSAAGLQRVLEAAERQGIPAREMEHLWRASEDFGYYLKECGGAMFYIGNGETWPALHTKDYDFNDRILETAADLFLAIIG